MYTRPHCSGPQTKRFSEPKSKSAGNISLLMQLLEHDCRTSQGRINSSARTGRVPTSSTHTAQGLVGEGCPDTASAPLEPDLDAALIGDAAEMAATYINDSTVMDVMSCLSTLTEVALSEPPVLKLAPCLYTLLFVCSRDCCLPLCFQSRRSAIATCTVMHLEV